MWIIILILSIISFNVLAQIPNAAIYQKIDNNTVQKTVQTNVLVNDTENEVDQLQSEYLSVDPDGQIYQQKIIDQQDLYQQKNSEIKNHKQNIKDKVLDDQKLLNTAGVNWAGINWEDLQALKTGINWTQFNP